MPSSVNPGEGVKQEIETLVDEILRDRNRNLAVKKIQSLLDRWGSELWYHGWRTRDEKDEGAGL